MENKEKKISKMKFSDLITELMEMWLNWMKHDKISHNDNFSYKTRKESAVKCENLIDRKYLILNQLDIFFEK